MRSLENTKRGKKEEGKPTIIFRIAIISVFGRTVEGRKGD